MPASQLLPSPQILVQSQCLSGRHAEPEPEPQSVPEPEPDYTAIPSYWEALREAQYAHKLP